MLYFTEAFDLFVNLWYIYKYFGTVCIKYLKVHSQAASDMAVLMMKSLIIKCPSWCLMLLNLIAKLKF